MRVFLGILLFFPGAVAQSNDIGSLAKQLDLLDKELVKDTLQAITDCANSEDFGCADRKLSQAKYDIVDKTDHENYKIVVNYVTARKAFSLSTVRVEKCKLEDTVCIEKELPTLEKYKATAKDIITVEKAKLRLAASRPYSGAIECIRAQNFVCSSALLKSSYLASPDLSKLDQEVIASLRLQALSAENALEEKTNNTWQINFSYSRPPNHYYVATNQRGAKFNLFLYEYNESNYVTVACFEISHPANTLELWTISQGSYTYLLRKLRSDEKIISSSSMEEARRIIATSCVNNFASQSLR